MALLDIKELEGFSGVFRGKAGNAFGRMLMHWLSVDKMNELYARHEDVSGPDFARDVLADIGMKVQIGFADGAFVEDVPYGGGAAVPDGAACGISEGESALEMLDRLLPQGPFITISNHPCGHVDGIALVDIFGHLRPG